MYLHLDLAIYATDRFVLACIALFLEAVIGRMSWLFRIIPHPFAILSSSAAFLGRRLNRSRRGPRALIVRGAIVTGFLCCVTGSFGWMISSWGETYPAGWVVDLMFWSFLSRSVAAIPTRLALCVRRARTALWPGGKRWRVITKVASMHWMITESSDL